MNDHTVDHSLCAAYGCPCKGTMTQSTSGSDKWFCGHHFAQDAIAWQRITAELNRLGYIVSAMQKITASRDKEDWPAVYREIRQELGINQRNNLLCQPQEGVSHWYARLDAELRNGVRDRRPAPELPLPTEPQAETWQRVQMPVPEHV